MAPPADFLRDRATPVDESLSAYAATADQLVPTRFDSSARDAGSVAARTNAVALWGLAERVKYAISGLSGSVRLMDVLSGERERAEFESVLGRGTRIPAKIIALALADIIVDRWAVDQLIRERLSRSVDQANRLVRSRLPDGDVDRVYLIGNSSRYPTVREVVTGGLKIGFVGERLHWQDGPDLKSAVAKGAAVAMRLSRHLSGFRVEFEGGYMDRLPYDVGYADYTIGAVRVLFQEACLYTELRPRLIPVPGSGSSARTVTLSRRWPGDETFAPFLIFQFSRPLVGPIRVWFAGGDDAPNQFAMCDEGTGAVVIGEEMEPEAATTNLAFGNS